MLHLSAVVLSGISIIWTSVQTTAATSGRSTSVYQTSVAPTLAASSSVQDSKLLEFLKPGPDDTTNVGGGNGGGGGGGGNLRLYEKTVRDDVNHDSPYNPPPASQNVSGTVVAPSSCSGRCGGMTSLPCSCDVKCSVYRNCCEDIERVCPEVVQDAISRLGFWINTTLSTCFNNQQMVIISCPHEYPEHIEALRDQSGQFAGHFDRTPLGMSHPSVIESLDAKVREHLPYIQPHEHDAIITSDSAG